MLTKLAFFAAFAGLAFFAAVQATRPSEDATPPAVFSGAHIPGLCQHLGAAPGCWIFEAGNEEGGDFLLEAYPDREAALDRLARWYGEK